jgi:ADP-heptose:LPS heptosyltransferase
MLKILKSRCNNNLFTNKITLILYKIYYLVICKFIKVDIFLFFNGGIGDDLLMTALCRLMVKQKGYKVCVMTRAPSLFFFNPNVYKVLSMPNDRNIRNTLYSFLKIKIKKEFVQLNYAKYDAINQKDFLPDCHIIEKMCNQLGLGYESNAVPEMFLTKKEKGKYYSKVPKICIQSAGIASQSYMFNKDWFIDRYNEVVSELSNRYIIYQIGSVIDPLLNNVIDLRGKTNLRETAALLFNSKYYIGGVGLLMHMAKAVGCKSIIIYGGRESPEQSGYLDNINLYSLLPCSPCGLRNFCHLNKLCMQMINASDVVSKVK